MVCCGTGVAAATNIERKRNMNTIKIVGGALSALALIVGTTGCDPEDVALLKKGSKLELTGRFAEAADKYAGAAALGNADAYQKLGDLTVTHDFVFLTPENPQDFVTGHDKWLVAAKQLIAKAKDLYEKAELAGCTNQLAVSRERLAKCETKVSETEAKVTAAKEQERVRQEELRRQKEEAERKAKEEAARKAEAARLKRGEQKGLEPVNMSE